MGMSNTRAGSKIDRTRYVGPAGTRNITSHQSATPNPAPHTVIDMMNLGAQAANFQTPSTPNAHQARDSQDGDEQEGYGQEDGEEEDGGQEGRGQQDDLNRPPPVPKKTPWFSAWLGLALIITAIVLLERDKNSAPRPKAEWTREGSAEMLSPSQVIFVSVSKKFIWARFCLFLGFQVLILWTGFTFATWAALATLTKAKIMMWRELVFTTSVVLLATLMWGWLIWFI